MLPAEWALQSAMLFVWPREGGDWSDGLDAARDCIAQAVAAVARDQKVILVAPDSESAASATAHPTLAAADTHLAHVVIHQTPANDIWIRDFGPLTTLEKGRRRFVDFRFNGWAGKYPADKDDRVTASLYQHHHLGAGDYQARDIILEGGALDSNGAGTLMVTRCCLLDAARNQADNQEFFDRLFAETLGIAQVHWLEHGRLEGDDTDGHVDTLVRFVAENHIVYQGCTDPADSHHHGLNALAAQLATLRQPGGSPYRLQALPLPRPRHEDGRRLPAGYANFLIANRVVLVPQYDDPADAEALRIIAGCFPDRQAIGIDCLPLIRQNGAIHCAAIQIPAHA